VSDEPADLTPEEEEALQAFVDGLVGGGLQLVVALIGAGVAWWVDSWAVDLVALLISMSAAVWAIVLGFRSRRALVTVHGVAIVLLDLLVLVSPPLG
jgi:hypothetical protein